MNSAREIGKTMGNLARERRASAGDAGLTPS
jgi:hypothetical protein